MTKPSKDLVRSVEAYFCFPQGRTVRTYRQYTYTRSAHALIIELLVTTVYNHNYVCYDQRRHTTYNVYQCSVCAHACAPTSGRNTTVFRKLLDDLTHQNSSTRVKVLLCLTTMVCKMLIINFDSQHIFQPHQNWTYI